MEVVKMSTAKITLIGLYGYDNTIFDTMSLPEVEIETDENGNHIAVTVEKNVVIDNMLLRYGEFEVLYPNPDFFKVAVKAVSDSLQSTFKRWIKAWNIEYNPLYNFDRYEKQTDNTQSQSELNGEAHNTGSNSLDGTDNADSGNTNTTSVTPYESDALHTQSQVADNGHDNRTIHNNGTDKSDSTNKSTGNETTDVKHDGHLYGNIGVTTSQQMLREELDISRWNIYDEIAKCFARELIIPVY
jgi:hypothetical protein